MFSHVASAATPFLRFGLINSPLYKSVPRVTSDAQPSITSSKSPLAGYTSSKRIRSFTVRSECFQLGEKNTVVQVLIFHSFTVIISKNLLQTGSQLDDGEFVLRILHLSNRRFPNSTLSITSALPYGRFPHSILSSDREARSILTVLS